VKNIGASPDASLTKKSAKNNDFDLIFSAFCDGSGSKKLGKLRRKISPGILWKSRIISKPVSDDSEEEVEERFLCCPPKRPGRTRFQNF
jgi:hypothetical protein